MKIFEALLCVIAVVGVTSLQNCADSLESIFTSGCGGIFDASCSDGQTLFDVVDPAEICTSYCKSEVIDTFNSMEQAGCCSKDTLYAFLAVDDDDSVCSTGAYLSYTGLSNAIEYLCSAVEIQETEYYCYADALDYFKSTATAVAQAQSDLNNHDSTGAMDAFAPVNCSLIVETQCCYPTMVNFANSCGGDNAQTSATAMAAWQTSVQTLCGMFQEDHVPSFDAVCDDLPSISSETCLAANDANCEATSTPAPTSSPTKNDDDAAVIHQPLQQLTTLLAAIVTFGMILIYSNNYYVIY